MKTNDNEPLWMPEGSVRAILALIIVITCLVYTFVYRADSSTLNVVMMAVLGFYFNAKKAKGNEL